MIFPICPKARQRRKEARPGELMSAALSVFAERGFAATRLDEVARRAGVSKGTVYLYFESKEALFKAAVEAAMTPAIEMSEQLAADTTLPPVVALRASMATWWEQMGNSDLGTLPKLLVAESGNFPELSVWFDETFVHRAEALAAAIVDRGIASGEFRRVDPRAVARLLHAQMFAYILWRRTCDSSAILPEPEQYFDDVIDVFINGLKKDKPCA